MPESPFHKRSKRIFDACLMQRKITGVCLLFAVVVASVFTWHEITKYSKVHVQSESLPSMEEALLQAIDLSAPLRIFSERDDFGCSRDVKISVIKLSDESIEVLFSEGPKSNGEWTVPLLGVLFTVTDRPSTEWIAVQWKNRRVDAESRLLSQALKSVIISQDLFDPLKRNEFVISVEKREEGFEVFYQQYPFGPGGHAGFTMSKDFEIVDVFLGA